MTLKTLLLLFPSELAESSMGQIRIVLDLALKHKARMEGRHGMQLYEGKINPTAATQYKKLTDQIKLFTDTLADKEKEAYEAQRTKGLEGK